MQSTLQRAPIGELWNSIQTWLFPVLEDELGELDDKPGSQRRQGPHSAEQIERILFPMPDEYYSDATMPTACTN